MITNYTLWRKGKFAPSVKRSLNYGGGIPINKSSSKIWQMHFALLFVLFFTQSIIAQTNYYSKATATDFNDVNSWGTATDGTGTSPASISNADNFFVANASVLSLSGNASVRQLTISSGSLTIATNTLTVSTATGNNSTFSINGGTLNMNSGSLVINGNMSVVTGVFNQAGGSIIIDPNSGIASTSVASGTATLLFSVATGTVSGGTITIVDPNFNSAGKAVDFNTPTGANSTWSINHTLRIGDGVSIDPSSNTSGFILESYTGTGKLVYGNLIIDSGSVTNRHASLGAWSIFVGGDLTVNSGSELRINSVATSGPISAVFSRNIINNGTITSTVPVIFAATSGTTTIANTIAQTVSGSGVFRNLTTSPTANFTSITINNTSSGGVTFPGTTNIAAQPTNSFSLSGTLTFTAGKINTVTGVPFILGASAGSSGTLSYTAGGFASGVTFGRWFGTTTTGSTITASTDATTVTSRYPFIGLNNASRSAWIERVTPAAAGGILGVTYTNVDGYTTASLTDGVATLDTKANDSWAVSSLSGTPTAAASFKLNIVAPGIFGGPLNTANVRIVKSDNTFVGTHQAGTVTPGGQRITILPADLTSGSFTLAVNAADVPYVSVATGNWNNPATWNKGTVPTCNDAVSIAASTTVTINSAGNVAKNITINSGGTLVQASGDLTVDACTSINNNFVNNNGTLTVTGGTLTVNGNLNNATGSTFNQSGGNINVDGNNGAVTANSVASGTHIVLIATDNVSLTGGTLTVVDPHAANSTSSYAFSYTGTAAVNNTAGWVLKFGNGTSTDAGGTTGTAAAAGGFIWNNAGGKIYYDNVVIDGGAGTNRNIYNSSTTIGINNLTINTNSELVMATSGIHIGSNFVNNGTFTHTAATLALQNFQSATASASVNPQSISGTGVFRNSLVTANVTANLNSVTVNNTNATGVTLNVPLSVGGTLTLTAGKVNTTNVNLLTLGTTTTAGTLSGGSATAYINGPFARTFATRTATGTYAATTLFPVGKSGSYLPIHIDPTTTGVVVMSGEAFNANSGTLGGGVVTLSPNRWEALVRSGNANFSGSFIRISDAATVSTNKILQAPSASGTYASITPATTFVAGTPNTITTATQITSANYTGYFAYGDLNICPVPSDQATAFVVGNLGATSFNGSFTVAASAPSNYLVVRYPSGSTVTNPVNYTVYTVGGTLGTGTVVAVLTAPSTTFDQTGLVAGTTYDYYVYSYNNVSCYGPSYNVTSPLTSSVTTCATATVAPTALATTNLTNSGFTLGWTATVTDALQLDIATNSTFTSFVTGYNSKPLVAGTTSEVVSGLNGNTVYYARLRAINGVCYSVNSATLTVTTLCDPVTAFSENFDSVTTPAFPSCWGKVGTLGTAYTQNTSSSTTPNCLYMYSSATASRSVVKMQPVSNASLGTHRLRFKLRGNFSSGETVEVGYLTNPSDASTFVVLQTVTASTTSYVEKIIEPGTAPGTNQVLAFRTGTALLSVLIDDVVWEPIPTDAVDYANLQAFVVNATAVSTMETCQTVDVYAQAYEPGVTEAAGQATGLTAFVGYSSTNTDPATWPESAWTTATFNVNAGNNDEFKATYATLPAGTYYFASRFQLNGGPYRYGASNNGFWNATTNPNAVFTVTAPAAINASATTPAFCSGGNTNLTAASTNANYTYSWSNGAGTGATVNVAPTVNTTYTVTGTDSVTGCTSTATVTVTVNPTPSVVSVTPSASTICAGSIEQFVATGGNISGSTTIGTATTLTSATSQPTAFCNRFEHYWSQMVFTAAELNAAGVEAGNINAIKFNITTLGDGTNVTDFHVYIGTTASSTLTGFTTTGLTEVFSTATYAHAIGLNTITFNTPYPWDGTSNIIVDIRQTGLDLTNNSQTYYTATTGNNTVVYAVTSVTNSGGSNGFAASNPSATTSVNRLNTTFDWSANADITWSSTGTGDLFTDATATIPYVSGNATTTVYAKPSATATYTATATIGTCTSTDNSVITVTPNTVPDFAEIGSICQGSVAPTLATTSPNGVTGTWAPATVSNTANGSYVFTPNSGQCAVTQTLNVTVNTTATPTGDATQYGTTLADLVVSPTTGITWYASEADALASTNDLPLTTVLVDGATYYATQTTTCESLPFAVTIDFDLKTPSFNMNSLKYYPNPVSNVLTVTYSEAITGLKLYNMVGQQLMSKSVNSNETQLDMSHLPAGSYLLEVTADNKSKTVKLLKNQ